MTQQQGRIVRLKELDRNPVHFFLDGKGFSALEGDTVLTAVLTAAPWLRLSDFGPEHRAGFCLMGACQDCWIWTEGGERLQACSTTVGEHMRLISAIPESWP
ncbi:(2Fe-2S)-binding protein [Mesorhizobium sp.]|uniref:(2Fe-2S)-binding protein n=1 Tax=Mesorhizobium sp. TaxID=1871066 RepID=UPI0025CFEA68|nr:(2Fe-2S)-binding protein [Mesorhizobium sp.]